MRKTNEKAITLIALVVTIIILLILAGISLNSILGQDGIIAKAKETKLLSEEAEALEQINLQSYSIIANSAEENRKITSKKMNDYIKNRVYNKTGQKLYSNEIIYEFTGEELNLDKDGIYFYSKLSNTVVKLTKKEYNKLSNKYAVWLWVNDDEPTKEYKYIINSTERKTLLNKLQQEGVSDIYVAVPLFNSKKEVIYQYKNFVKEASERGIAVSALIGDPAFIKEKNREEAIYTYIDNLYNYNMSVKQEEKFQGLHYDVEAHGIWESETTETEKNKAKKLYIEFAKLAKEYSKGKNITIEYDINIGYNKITYIDDNGEEKNIGEEICKYSDEVVLMDYREDASSIYNNIIEKGYNSDYNYNIENSWKDLAKKYNKNVVIGVDIEILKETYTNNYSLNLIHDITNGVTDKIKKDNDDLSYYYAIHSANLLQSLITDNAEKNEITTVEEAKNSGTRMIGNTELKDSNNNIIIVPDGFKIATDSGINVTEGIVIEDNDIINGIGNNRGNQYVWIPVGKNIKKSSTENVEITLGRYTFDNEKVNLIQDAKDYENIVTLDGNFKEIASSRLGTKENGLNTTAMDLKGFVESTNSYGGYYIARYEASYGVDGKANSKISNNYDASKQEGTLWNYVTQLEAAEASRKIYNNSNYETDLMNSYTWDTTLVYLQKFSDNPEYSQKSSTNTSTNNTGENDDEVCKINDLASNAREWTTEYSDSSDGQCVGRGGSARQSTLPTKLRYSNTNQDSDYHITFRAILYLK